MVTTGTLVDEAVSNGRARDDGVGDVPLTTLAVCISELLSSMALLSGIDDRAGDSAM